MYSKKFPWLTCAIAKKGISMQTSESVNAKDMCSLSVYAPTIHARKDVSKEDTVDTRLDRLTSLDGVDGDQERYAETLPEGEEQDTLDTEEFGWGREACERRYD